MQHAVQTLDARNIGSAVGLNVGDGEFIFGTIAAVTRDVKAREVTIDLDTIDYSITVPFDERVDVQLRADALYALHARNGIDDLVKVAVTMAETVNSIAEQMNLPVVNIPTLRVA